MTLPIAHYVKPCVVERPQRSALGRAATILWMLLAALFCAAVWSIVASLFLLAHASESKPWPSTLQIPEKPPNGCYLVRYHDDTIEFLKPLPCAP